MKKNVTLVLSGGGARGFAHIGVIEELESRGFIINSVAGTSMGALIGGVYATGKLNAFKEWAYNLDKQEVLKLVDFSFSNHGLIKGDRVLKAMKKFIPDANIEDLKINYTATAFDLAQNKEIVFRLGSLYNAIRASISIPTVFTPVISGSSVFVDGGIVNNMPISNAGRTKDDILIAVNVNADLPVNKPFIPKSEREKRHEIYMKKMDAIKKSLFKTNSEEQKISLNYFKLIDGTISALTNNLAAAILKGNPPDILIDISRNSCGVFDFFKAEELVEIGRYAAQKKLDSLKD